MQILIIMSWILAQRDDAHGERPLRMLSLFVIHATMESQKEKKDFLKSNYQKAIHLA